MIGLLGQHILLVLYVVSPLVHSSGHVCISPPCLEIQEKHSLAAEIKKKSEFILLCLAQCIYQYTPLYSPRLVNRRSQKEKKKKTFREALTLIRWVDLYFSGTDNSPTERITATALLSSCGLEQLA